MNATDLTLEQENGILAQFRFKRDDVQCEVSACMAFLHEAMDELEDLAAGTQEVMPDTSFPSRSEAREAAAMLTTLACSLSAVAMRMVRHAGRLEGLCEAAERSDKSDEMVEAHKNGELNCEWTWKPRQSAPIEEETVTP